MICNDKVSNNFQDLGTTEAIMGENIIFSKVFLLDYIFEKEQLLKLIITSPEDYSLEFTINTTIARIMGSRNFNYKHDIIFSENGKFDLIIDAKNFKNSKEMVKIKTMLNFSSTINYKNVLKYYDTKEMFFTVNNCIKGDIRGLYKSEEVKESNYLEFSEFNIPKDLLCENNSDVILIRLYDSNFMEFAEIKTDLQKMLNNCNIKVVEIKSKEIIGNMSIFAKQIIKKTFVDYLGEGMQINLVIGIDFTASNEAPSRPNSLHYVSGNEPNFYERAISSCGTIVSYYDYDKIFPVFGFGAQFMGSNVVNHCFNLNFSQDPNINGLDNVLDCYKSSVYKLNFSGPTYFSPLIKNTINIVKYNLMQSQEQIYYILMILSDGQINDMSQTCDALVEAANLPISVIIIGIGSADFTNMNILDGDEIPITSSAGEKIKRDIVQFVEFRRFEGDALKLSEEVLAEIPKQVEEYYMMKN